MNDLTVQTPREVRDLAVQTAIKLENSAHILRSRMNVIEEQVLSWGAPKQLIELEQRVTSISEQLIAASKRITTLSDRLSILSERLDALTEKEVTTDDDDWHCGDPQCDMA